MSNNEGTQYQAQLREGLELAEYNWLKERAMRNMMVSQANADGEPYEVSARELFVKLYHEPAPTYEVL